MSTMRIERKKLRLRLASFCSEVEKKKKEKKLKEQVLCPPRSIAIT